MWKSEAEKRSSSTTKNERGAKESEKDRAVGRRGPRSEKAEAVNEVGTDEGDPTHLHLPADG